MMPGGVNSPVRAYMAVGGVPRFMAQGRGSVVTDVDGVEYIDYVGSWGPLILGHAYPDIVNAIEKAARLGTTFGAPTEAETRLAALIVDRIPSVGLVRLVSSGTEAVMSAIRLARAFTGRSIIIKCAGCYHGHSDGMLVDAGSGALTLGTPSSPGVTDGAAGETIVLPYNDIAAMRGAFESHRDAIAAVVIEPVAGNMGCVPPGDGYLLDLAEACSKHGSLLILDEVMTGFRVSPGGAQERYGVSGDLTRLGKIVGGGMPLAAYGGRREIMEMVAPSGPVYQAGTLSGNPLATAAGIATLEALSDATIYDKLESASVKLEEGLIREATDSGVSVTINRIASMLTVFFTTGPVTDLASAQSTDRARFGRFFHAMLDRGVYLPPSPFECWFVSAAHSADDIERTILAAGESFRAIG